MTRQGATIFVPAFNEERNLRDAVASAVRAAERAGVDFEIIVADDGSTDGTAAVVKELEERHPFLRSISHRRNLGMGVSFLEAASMARFDKIALFPGDNVISMPTLAAMLENARRADLVLAYLINTECRTWFRNLLSGVFSLIQTATFDLNLRYIQATPVYSVRQVLELGARCRRYSFPSEVTIKLLRQGCTFVEIPGYMNPGARKSSALRLRNLLEVVAGYLALVWDVHVRRRGRFGRAPVRVLPEEVRAGLRRA